MAASIESGIEFARNMEQRTINEQPSAAVSEDEVFVRAARDGDREAFGQLYGRYARMVHGVLLARVPPHEADDLVQDVFILALRRLPTLREPGRFGAWIAAIARNRAYDYHRRSVPEEPIEDDLPDETAGSARRDPEIQAGAILAVVKSLPEAYRETLILRFVEGMTGPEIAAHTGMTPGSVRVNLHRGMQQLRAKLKLTTGANGPEEEKA